MIANFFHGLGRYFTNHRDEMGMQYGAESIDSTDMRTTSQVIMMSADLLDKY